MKKRKKEVAAALVAATAAFSLAMTTSARASAAGYELGGFAQSSSGVRLWPTSACTPAGVCRFMLGEERLELKLQAHTEGQIDAAFTAVADFVHDEALSESRLDPRELYVDLLPGRATVRIGRQVVSWGTGDLFFVNDIFPKDWESFYLGRPFEYFKVASDGLRVLFAPFDLVLVPRFAPDAVPTSTRFLGIADNEPRVPVSGGPPQPRFRNVEAALRVYGSWKSWDANLYLSKTFYRTPVFRSRAPGELQMRYPRLLVLGGSLVGPLLGGVANLELGMYYSGNNLEANDPELPFSTARGLVGYARPLWDEATLSLQFFAEAILQYRSYQSTLPPGQPKRDRIHPMASLKFVQALLEQTLQFNLLAVYGVSPEEGFVNATTRYSFNDAVWAELGTNLFGGESSGSIGMFRRDSNAFLNVRYAF